MAVHRFSRLGIDIERRLAATSALRRNKNTDYFKTEESTNNNKNNKTTRLNVALENKTICLICKKLGHTTEKCFHLGKAQDAVLNNKQQNLLYPNNNFPNNNFLRNKNYNFNNNNNNFLQNRNKNYRINNNFLQQRYNNNNNFPRNLYNNNNNVNNTNRQLNPGQLTQDSSKIEVNNMKIDFCKIITLNKIQIILK